MATTFEVLAEPNRRRILDLLRAAERPVGDLVEELAARGTTVLLSTHILEVAQALCRRVAIIDRGHIVATGTMDELRAQAGSEQASLEDLFLKLTAGPESKELIERLLAPKQ